MKQYREDQLVLGNKTFFTSRLTPMEFYHTKRRLMEAATNKAASDWINHILQSKAEQVWKTDRDYVMKPSASL